MGITHPGDLSCPRPLLSNPSSLDLDPSKAFATQREEEKKLLVYVGPELPPAGVLALGLQPGEVWERGRGDSRSRTGGPSGSWGWGSPGFIPQSREERHSALGG